MCLIDFNVSTIKYFLLISFIIYCLFIADLDANIKRKLECTTCGKAFIHEIHLRKHMLSHGKIRGRNVSTKSCFKTDLQKQSFSTSTEHNQSYQCTTCLKFFATKRTLQAHSIVHSRGRNQTCTVRNKTCRRGNSSQGDMIHHTRNRRYHCDLCNSTFIRKQHLNKHILTHTGEKPFSCQSCGKRFTQTGGMR